MKYKIALFFSASVFLLSCNKDCYDAELAKQYESALCTQDCPGVKGCDGKTYCNECIANSHGIRIE